MPAGADALVENAAEGDAISVARLCLKRCADAKAVWYVETAAKTVEAEKSEGDDVDGGGDAGEELETSPCSARRTVKVDVTELWRVNTELLMTLERARNMSAEISRPT